MSNTNVSSGVTSSGLTFSDGNSLTVLSGGTAISITVDAGGEEFVSGTADDTLVGNGGFENVSAGGATSATTVGDGGNENIYGGTVVNTAVDDGGNENVNGGAVSGTTIDNGGTTTVYAGAVSKLVLDGGVLEMQGGTETGTIVNSGGAENVFGGTVTSTTVGDGGTETVYAGASVNDTDLLAGGAIDRTDFAFASGATVSLNTGNDTLTVSEGGSVDTLTLSGNHAGETFRASSDGNGGTLITQSPACYGSGTLIRTSRGEVAVEHLQAGDVAVTRRHGCDFPARIVWVGQRCVDIASHPHPEQVRPIRVAPGALGNGLPSRPLLLSPDHALLFEGVLIAARQLVNGATITVEFVPAVHYFHVELDHHGILLANGVAAESYLDTGNRSQFSNAGSLVAMHADFSRADHPKACAPLVTEAALVRPVWQRLAARARALGHTMTRPATTRDADLRLLLPSGEVQCCEPARDGQLLFALHGRGAEIAFVRLRSRHSAASDIRPWQDDRRQLGVAVGGIRLWMQCGAGPDDVACALPLHSDRLGRGWWDVEREAERTWRWTDGNATLVLPPGCVRVEISVTATADYLLADADAGSPGIAVAEA